MATKHVLLRPSFGRCSKALLPTRLAPRQREPETMGSLESTFRDKSALITGGASGIGLALGRRLQAAGARVTLADLDGRAQQGAQELSEASDSRHPARGVELDVRDRVGFNNVVDQIRDNEGQLDLLFNNAGVTLGGRTEQMRPDDWDHVLDVNIRGVIHGIEAGFPAMIEQGSGHIVNTASAAGLMAAPFTVAYSTSKFAVVGLSNALRPEAATHGIGLTVLCPGMVETPILDQEPPLDGSGALTPRAYLKTMGLRPISADSFARAALAAVAKNKPLVVTPANVRIGWAMSRFAPRLNRRLNSLVTRRVVRAMTDLAPDDSIGATTH